MQLIESQQHVPHWWEGRALGESESIIFVLAQTYRLQPALASCKEALKTYLVPQV